MREEDSKRKSQCFEKKKKKSPTRTGTGSSPKYLNVLMACSMMREILHVFALKISYPKVVFGWPIPCWNRTLFHAISPNSPKKVDGSN